MHTDDSCGFHRVNPYWFQFLSTLGIDFGSIKGNGCFVIDKHGKRYLDGIAGFGAISLGHSNKVLLKKIKDFLSTNFVNLFPFECSELQSALGEKLISVGNNFFEKIFFCSSGSEAVESAIKFAMLSRKRNRVVSFENSFHGLNLYSSFVTGSKLWTDDIPWAPSGIEIVPRDLNAVEQALRGHNVAAIILEPVSGSSRAFSWSADALDQMRSLCDIYGTLLIFDEVYSGFGRSGDWLAYQAIGMQGNPDMAILSKGMTGGLVPLSVILLRDTEFSAMFGRPGKAKIHGSTFSGNRLAIQCCLFVLEIMQALKIPSGVRRMGEVFATAIAEDFKDVLSTHGLGLALSIELADPQHGLVELNNLWKRLMYGGVITMLTPHKPNALRFSPPLTFGDEELDFFLATLKTAVVDV